VSIPDFTLYNNVTCSEKIDHFQKELKKYLLAPASGMGLELKIVTLRLSIKSALMWKNLRKITITEL